MMKQDRREQTSQNTINKNCFDGVWVKDELMLEILSRLPAKSLMRFKCVRKSWLYLIEEDKYFLSLHTCQLLKSQQQQLLITCSNKRLGTSFFTQDLFQPNKEYVQEYIGEWEKGAQWQKKHILVSPYGLVCYVNYNEYSVRIYNNCIKEITPWIKSNKGKDLFKRSNYNVIPVCGFGFDPITQKHKVVFIWGRMWGNITDEDFEEMPLCEVLTVGENIWRTIETDTPMKNIHGHPIYANGSLYWIDDAFSPYHPENVNSILGFDVGKEKFRAIKYPNNIFKSRLPHVYPMEDLLEVDGHLALIERYCYDEKGNPSDTEMKLWSYIEDGKESRWIEEPFELPRHVKDNAYGFISIPGTNKLIITTRTRPLKDENFNEKCFGLYIYDIKEKKWNKYGSITDPMNKSQKNFPMYSSWCEFSIIVQSIYPVRHQTILPTVTTFVSTPNK